MIDVRPDGFVVIGRERAKPLAPEERRAAIIDAVIPLLREKGREVSSKQIAEAAGVAEGTLFRAFGDKDSIFQAAIARYFDPQPFRDAMRGIDPDDPTEAKILQVLTLFRERFTGVIGFTSAMQIQPKPPAREDVENPDWFTTLGQLFHDGELTVPIDTLGYYIRLIAFASSIGPFNDIHPFATEDLMRLISRGVTQKKEN